MSDEQKQREPELPTGNLEDQNPDLDESVESANELKAWFVDYVGKKHEPEDGTVTVGMIVNVFAEEFPEFLMVVAEENWVRGYRQGVNDAEVGVRAALEQAGVEPEVAAQLSSFEIVSDRESNDESVEASSDAELSDASEE